MATKLFYLAKVEVEVDKKMVQYQTINDAIRNLFLYNFKIPLGANGNFELTYKVNFTKVNK